MSGPPAAPSRLRRIVTEVLGEACEFGGGWDRATFEAKADALLAAAAAKELVGAVVQEQRQAGALDGWSVVAFWRNDGKADLELHCPGYPACPWLRTSYGNPDGEATLIELVLAAVEHRRIGHTGKDQGS